jgi:vacuolar-type H+-ATPase subunit I/STV1
MKIGDRERLVNRVRQIRRTAAGNDAQPASEPDSDRPQLDAVEARIAHLEKLLEGLQDSVHRESERQGRRLAELEARIQPAALGEAMSKDARQRGL